MPGRVTIAAMGLFHRSDEGSDLPAAGPAGASAVADQVAATFGSLSRLSLPERAAELLITVAPAIEQADDYRGMQNLLASWLPDTDWMNWSPEQRETWYSLQLLLQEAFGVLVLTRMLIRRESQYQGATDVTYALGPDGRAAQSRGDVAEIVARRLPD
jgi:hypothetical protein